MEKALEIIFTIAVDQCKCYIRFSNYVFVNYVTFAIGTVLCVHSAFDEVNLTFYRKSPYKAILLVMLFLKILEQHALF